MGLRIAMIIERTDITLGGAERSVFEMTAALSAMGHHVDILAAKGQGHSAHIHILCKNHPSKRVSIDRFEKALQQHLSKHTYDIVHSVLPFGWADIYHPRGGSYRHAMIRNAASYPQKWMRHFKRISNRFNKRRSTLIDREKNLCQNSNAHVIALSGYVADYFRQNDHLSEDRLTIIPNGVKPVIPSDPQSGQRLRSQILQRLGLTDCKESILYVLMANNFRLKGLRPLIDAFAGAVKEYQCNHIYLVVAGRGKSLPFRRQAHKNGIEDRIVFLGHVKHSEHVLSMCDVAVLPTYYDPSSRFILEALSLAKPVITTRHNGVCDVFEDNRHGVVINEPTDTDTLTEAIFYYSQPEHIEQSKQTIIEDKITDHIKIQRVARQIDSLYNAIISKRSQ